MGDPDIYDASRCLSSTFLDPIPEYFRDRTLLANAGAQSGGTEGSSSKIKPDNAGELNEASLELPSLWC